MPRIPERVLLIEDNRDLCGALTDILRYYLPTVQTVAQVHSLREAHALLTQEPFDCAVLDLILPDAEGLQAFRAIRQQCPQLPLVILTGHPNAEHARVAEQAGVPYLKKPLEGGAVMLPQAIQRALAFADARDAGLQEAPTLHLSPPAPPGPANGNGRLSAAEAWAAWWQRVAIAGLSVLLMVVGYISKELAYDIKDLRMKRESDMKEARAVRDQDQALLILARQDVALLLTRQDFYREMLQRHIADHERIREDIRYILQTRPPVLRTPVPE